MLIGVLLGGVTAFREDGVPYVTGGEPGFMESDELELKTYTKENDEERTEIIEYWEGDQLRHRSVNMVLKKGLAPLIEQAIFGS